MTGYCVGTSTGEMWGRIRGTGGGGSKNRWRKLHEFRNFYGDDRKLHEFRDFLCGMTENYIIFVIFYVG